MKLIDVRDFETVEAYKNTAYKWAMILSTTFGNFELYGDDRLLTDLTDHIKAMPFLLESNGKLLKIDEKTFKSFTRSGKLPH